MTDESKQTPHPILAESSFAARTVALDHYRKTSAIVNQGPKPPPTIGQQLQDGKRVMAASDHPRNLLKFP